jgi:hypothetical protein
MTMQILNPKKVLKLKNDVCPYCGSTINDANRTEDHVVGRRFVPKSTMENRWNLILLACKKCNGEKSSLEDDISAISMQPAIGEHRGAVESILAKESSRKARNAISRRSKKRVSESQETSKLSYNLLDQMKVDVEMISPPQIDQKRLLELNAFHLEAFFFLLTYNERKGRGHYPPGEIFSIDIANRGDWGNVKMRAFMKLTEFWVPHLNVITADGYFKIRIDKNPLEKIWSWALEYNKNTRSVGVFGDSVAIELLLTTIPEHRWSKKFRTASEPNVVQRHRMEIPLSESDDKLFTERSI